MSDAENSKSDALDEVLARQSGMAASLPEATWPPAPKAPSKPAVDAKYCPNCGRKLLTQSSALCNWCGVKVDDPEFQEKAAQSRQERDEADKAAIDAVIQEEAAYGVWGRLKRKGKIINRGGSGSDLKP